MTGAQFKQALNESIPNNFQVSSDVKVIIDPQNKIVYIEAISDEKQKTKRT